LRCAVTGTGAPAQIPDGSAVPSLPFKFQYCTVVKPNARGEIIFAITPNVVGNFAICRGKIDDFPVYDLTTSAWLTTSFNPETDLVAGPQVGQVFVTSTFPDLRNGNPITAGQNEAFYKLQSWRMVDSCAKITYRGPPLYASGTAQVVRGSVVQERLTGIKVQGTGGQAVDFLSQATLASGGPLGVTDVYPQQIAANPGLITGNAIIPPTQILGDLRLELSTNGPTNSAEVCSMVGAESFQASTTLHAKSIMQDQTYQPWVDGAIAIANVPTSGLSVNTEVPCWGQLIQGVETFAGTTSNGVQLIPGTLPGYGHGDTTFFVYTGLPIDATGGASLFIECEACFEGTLGRRSNVGRLARPAPAKDPTAIEVVSDIQRKLPAASEHGNWLSDAANFYIGGMRKAIGFSYNVGAQVASAAGFKTAGDLASAVANLMIDNKTSKRRMIGQ
jgi:hypothetical protein